MNPETKAIKRNSLSLLTEYEKLAARNDELSDRIAILESQIKVEKEQSKNLSIKNQELEGRIKDLTSKNKTLQESNASLSHSRDQLIEIQTVYNKLEAKSRPPSLPPIFYEDQSLLAECEAINRSLYGKTFGENLPVPIHLQPLIDTLKKTLK